jgi:hypothetical protein
MSDIFQISDHCLKRHQQDLEVQVSPRIRIIDLPKEYTGTLKIFNYDVPNGSTQSYDMGGDPCFCCMLNEETKSIHKAILFERKSYSNAAILKSCNDRRPIYSIEWNRSYIMITLHIKFSNNKDQNQETYNLKLKIYPDPSGQLSFDFYAFCHSFFWVCGNNNEFVDSENNNWPEELKSNDPEKIIDFAIQQGVFSGQYHVDFMRPVDSMRPKDNHKNKNTGDLLVLIIVIILIVLIFLLLNIGSYTITK